jgi:hypothetical protein
MAGRGQHRLRLLEKSFRSIGAGMEVANLGSLDFFVSCSGWHRMTRIESIGRSSQLLDFAVMVDLAMRIDLAEWVPFLIWCISGPRSPAMFLVELVLGRAARSDRWAPLEFSCWLGRSFALVASGKVLEARAVLCPPDGSDRMMKRANFLAYPLYRGGS